MPEAMKLYGSTKKKKVPSLEVVDLILVDCNLVDNQCQQKSEVLYTFMPNKSYAYLLNFEPSNFVFQKLITQSLMKLPYHLWIKMADC